MNKPEDRPEWLESIHERAKLPDRPQFTATVVMRRKRRTRLAPRANLRLLDQGEWSEGDDSVEALLRGRG